MKQHLEQRNKQIRERYWELLPRLGEAKMVYEKMWEEFHLRPISLHQIVHHIEWYDKALRD